MLYDIDWVKGLSESDLALVNLLSFMRLYHYNLVHREVKKNIRITEAEAHGVKRITVKLRTQDDKTFTPSPYFLHDAEAELFHQKLIEYYEKKYNERS
jgi:hypothetical protein